MKWFVYLFSVYILVLTGFICEADADCCVNEIEQHHSHNESGEQDHKPVCPCSPFFACGGCHAIVATVTVLDISIDRPLSTGLTFFYAGSKLADFSVPVWQPPQTA